MELNFEQDMEIDPDALDVECLRQASLFYRYSQEEAKAKKEHAEAWENLKVIRSQLIKIAGEDKSLKNAQMVEAFYRDHPDHQKAKQEMIEKEYQANMASSACFAIRQRKDMLETLTRLALADYFARPTEPRNLSEEYGKTRETATQEVREKTAEKLRERPRRERK